MCRKMMHRMSAVLLLVLVRSRLLQFGKNWEDMTSIALDSPASVWAFLAQGKEESSLCLILLRFSFDCSKLRLDIGVLCIVMVISCWRSRSCSSASLWVLKILKMMAIFLFLCFCLLTWTFDFPLHCCASYIDGGFILLHYIFLSCWEWLIDEDPTLWWFIRFVSTSCHDP